MGDVMWCAIGSVACTGPATVDWDGIPCCAACYSDLEPDEKSDAAALLLTRPPWEQMDCLPGPPKPAVVSGDPSYASPRPKSRENLLDDPNRLVSSIEAKFGRDLVTGDETQALGEAIVEIVRSASPPSARCCATCKHWASTWGYPAACEAIKVSDPTDPTEAWMCTDPPGGDVALITVAGFRCSLWTAATGCTCPPGQTVGKVHYPGWNPYCPEHGTADA